jgi:hypothetical protein
MTRILRSASRAAAVCALAALALAPRPAAAQDKAPLTNSFESLPEFIRAGDAVKVVTPQGGVAIGRVLALSPSSITIDERRPATFRAQYVKSIYGEPGRRPVWKGAKIGLLSGVVLAALVALGSAAEEDCAPDECMTGRDVLIAFAALPAMGAGLMIPGTRPVIYQAERRGSISLAPVAGRGQRGLAVCVAF